MEPSADARAAADPSLDATVEALLAQARDSADAERTAVALTQLTDVLEDGGARLSAGASDVLAAAIGALRRHTRHARAQLAGALVLERHV